MKGDEKCILYSTPAAGGKKESLAGILYNQKISFSNGGRENWRNNRENDGFIGGMESVLPGKASGVW